MYSFKNAVSSLKNDISKAVQQLCKEKNIDASVVPDFNIEIPADNSHGNFSSNAALVCAKIFKASPRNIAEIIVNKLPHDSEYVAKTEIAGPGFINFFLSDNYFSQTLKEIKKCGKSYGDSDYGAGKKTMVEFVSANPTGPMHMGNARLGALGDCLASILHKSGYDVYKEFYVNDAGNQIEKFGLSLDVRYRQICLGENAVEMPEECYQGDDITDFAREFFEINGDKYINLPDKERKNALVNFALPKNISRMKSDMKKYKVVYDNWFYESDLHKNGDVDRIINLLGKKGYTYEKDGSLWYRATEFGAEKDDVLRRQNEIPTYFAADIAYHYNKFISREFDTCIDIWGADHHGHVERMKGAMEALGIGRERFHIILVQLVRLMKNGEVVRMSKRTGKAIRLHDLIEDVGADAARFLFNMHEAGSGMDFDLDLAVKQDAQNPVYYVQYAHARICSVLKKPLDDAKLYSDFESNIDIDFSEHEKNLIFFMSEFPEEIERSAKDYDPARLTKYIVTFAGFFHKFYSSCKIISDNRRLTEARLEICRCAKEIINITLDMFKVDAPETMNQN